MVHQLLPARLDIDASNKHLRRWPLVLPNRLHSDLKKNLIYGMTDIDDRDPFAGTPWHKYVPARVTAVAG
ncbi:MAG: hypothetical protein WCK28_10975 [Burkholderiales bacterium]